MRIWSLHPQLERFKAHKEPVKAIDTYLLHVWNEASKRGYSFDKTKVGDAFTSEQIPVTDGQLKYEFLHLQQKLKTRDPAKYQELKGVQVHPFFHEIRGPVASWEKV
jgi:hypothetical protein